MNRHEWAQDARRGAATTFGARHYRAYAAWHYGRRLAAPAAILAAVLALGAGLVAAGRAVPIPVLLLAAAGLTFAGGAARIAAALNPRSRSRGAGAGWLLAAGAVLTGIAAWLS